MGISKSQHDWASRLREVPYVIKWCHSVSIVVNTGNHAMQRLEESAC